LLWEAKTRADSWRAGSLQVQILPWTLGPRAFGTLFRTDQSR